MSEKTCFVIIGYGKKMDYSTGREIDLDKTFEYIIKPVFDELGFICFRASDIKHSGFIDLPMYEGILKADFVLADLSTLNANVLYELGVRHAVRKETTIIISEKRLQYPFDLSHISIEQYEHLGNAIDYGEVERFLRLLKDKILELNRRPRVDSPLYTIFPRLEVPKFTQEEVDEIKENIREDGSLSDIMSQAEEAKNTKDYGKAIALLEKAKSLNQDNILVVQRLALITYKSELPNKLDALKTAKSILETLHPSSTTDLETLGLAGAINKRLFEELDDKIFLDKSLWFYEKGFYIGENYYTGINVAYLFNIKAAIENDQFEAYAHFGNARRIRNKVIAICHNIMEHKSWRDRDDKEWVYLTLAEAFFGIGDLKAEEKSLSDGKEHFKKFSLDSYKEQKGKLGAWLKIFNDKYSGR